MTRTGYTVPPIFYCCEDATCWGRPPLACHAAYGLVAAAFTQTSKDARLQISWLHLCILWNVFSPDKPAQSICQLIQRAPRSLVLASTVATDQTRGGMLQCADTQMKASPSGLLEVDQGLGYGTVEKAKWEGY